MNREQILFVVTLVTVGLLAWLRVSDGPARTRVPSARSMEAATVDLPALVRDGRLESDRGRTGVRERPLFAPPRELLPLDPLVLPPPPLPLLSVLRPSVRPSLQGAAARAYRVRPEDLGSLSLEGGDGAGLAPLGNGGLVGGLLDDLTEALDAATDPSSGDVADLSDTVLETRFDWLVRLGMSRRIYGHILNDDPHGLRDRPLDDLTLQQVSERHGGPLGLPFTVPRDEVERFGLAETFENVYRFASRELGSGPGSSSARRALAAEMLAAWPEQPQALDFALAEGRAALDASPRDTNAARLLAAILRRARDVEGELAIYRGAVEAGWADAGLYAGYARLVADMGLPERAGELLDESAGVSRGSAEVSFVRGLLAAQSGRTSEALAALKSATQFSVDVPFDDGEVALAYGGVLMAAGRLDDARREASRLLLEDAGAVGALRLLAATHAAEDDLGTASETLGSALALAPDDASVLTDAGVLAWRSADGAGALRLLGRARDLDPYRAAAPTLAMGFLHEDAGLPEVARELYGQVLLAEPGHPEALYRLGRNQRRDGDPSGAVSTLREALRLSGPDVLLLLELARASVDRGRFHEAQRYLREAERLEPDNGEVQWALGLAALRAGDAFGARSPLEQAVTLGQPGAHVALAVAAYRRGEEDDALDHLGEVEKAFAGRGDDPQALYAAEQEARIRRNRARRQWLDHFGRSTLQRGWTEHQWDGSPRVFLDDGALLIEGRMERTRETERPGVSRPVDGRGFFGVQGEVVNGEIGAARTGLSLSYRAVKGARGSQAKARLDIWVDADGAVRMSVLDNFDRLIRDAEPVGGVVVPRGAPALLGVERVDDKTGAYVFTLDGRTVGAPVELKSLRGFDRTFDLELWAEAAPGGRVSASVSLVRIVQAP